MVDDDIIPEGYGYKPSPSAYINHMGKVYHRRSQNERGEEIVSAAIRIEDHHVNSWGLAHGSLIAGMAEIGCAGTAYVEGGPPVVAVDMSIQFIGAPKLGELLEVHGWTTKRTRSLVFTQCRAESDGKIVFTATSVQKVIGA
ncbi:PaaI family thioesterase [Sphingobium sp.]|uniref:PaaI family thioesterase n=1 Tax=Sphingobium sp. TaxID=1912891 RepID=UPI002C0E75CC|nr:PaaI family thioesterase [Sphingobium sp.]HUD93912.1 PaaI family thioesterase [Sphingobium sp.]